MKHLGQRVGQRRSLFIVLAALALIAAIWSTLLISGARQQTLDARVQRVAMQLKCLVCQGESVADSPSTLAQQMRGVIREQLQAGRSEQEIVQYFQQRYGDEITWSPPWQGFALLAWLIPIAFVFAGAVLLVLLLRNWQARRPTAVGQSYSAQMTKGLHTDGEGEERMDVYRAQLEAELAEEDVLFRPNKMEAR